MKSFLFILAMLTSSVLTFGQQAKPNFSVEYSPALSRLTNQIGRSADGRFSFGHQICLRAEKAVGVNWGITAGIGLLNTRNYSYLIIDGNGQAISIGSQVHYNYLTLPIGFKYTLGTFFFHPEVGVGINLSPRRTYKRSTYEYSNGSSVEFGSIDVDPRTNAKAISFPISISIGKCITIPSGTLTVGVRGYYSLNSILERPIDNQHYVGFGALIGYQF